MRENGGRLRGLGGWIFTGKVGKAYQEALKHLSPSNHVDKNCVPTIFLTGDADNLKLYPQSQEYVAKLQSLGVDSELFTAPGKKHGFTWEYWDPVSLDSVLAIVKFFDKYLK